MRHYLPPTDEATEMERRPDQVRTSTHKYKHSVDMKKESTVLVVDSLTREEKRGAHTAHNTAGRAFTRELSPEQHIIFPSTANTSQREKKINKT